MVLPVGSTQPAISEDPRNWPYVLQLIWVIGPWHVAFQPGGSMSNSMRLSPSSSLCLSTRLSQGRDDYHAAGARRFVEYLQTIGVLLRACAEPEPVPTLVTGFCDWMREHRGVAESTLANYVPLVADFLAALGEDTSTYEAGAVRAFIFARANQHGRRRAKSIVNAVRMFLRFRGEVIAGLSSPGSLRSAF